MGWLNESNNVKHVLWDFVDDKDFGTELTQIRSRLSLVRMRESNNILQAAQQIKHCWSNKREQKKYFTMFDRNLTL